MRAGDMSPGGGIVTVSPAPNTRAPNTRRIGCAKLSAVYCVAGRGSGNPQAQAGARRSACEANRWITNTVNQADPAMNRNTSRPLYELCEAAVGWIDSP